MTSDHVWLVYQDGNDPASADTLLHICASEEDAKLAAEEEFRVDYPMGAVVAGHRANARMWEYGLWQGAEKGPIYRRVWDSRQLTWRPHKFRGSQELQAWRNRRGRCNGYGEPAAQIFGFECTGIYILETEL